MIMCHMVADSFEELHRMADAIGIGRRHFQKDHYDICKSKRKEAVRLGAVGYAEREIVRIINRRGDEV